MTSTSGGGIWNTTCQPGADWQEEFDLPGDLSGGTVTSHVRLTFDGPILATITGVLGSYDASADTTPLALSLAATATVLLRPQTLYYDALIVKTGVLTEFWVTGEFVVERVATRPGVP